MTRLMKFGGPPLGDSPYEYPDCWADEPTTDGGTRLTIAPAHDQVDLLLALTEPMQEPFGLLYVLVVPRGDGQAGRHQASEQKTREEVRDFLTSFQTFLESDARHNLWIASTASSEMLVYDRHNVIYAYGREDVFLPVLAASGLTRVEHVQIPSPHSHHYHQTMDSEESRLFSYWGWLRFPLQDVDDQ